MNKQKRVIIIAGPNGSGKTTLSKELLKEFHIDFLNADLIAEKLNPNDFQAVRIKAGKEFLRTIDTKINKGESFALESTLSGTYLIRIINLLKKKKYKVSIIFIFIENTEAALQRIKIRVQKGGHDVPKEDVLRRFHRSLNNFWKTYRKLSDDWQLIYNGEESLSFVASGTKNTETIIDESKFKLFKKGLSK